MNPRVWIILGALSAASAVGWGAYHAHGMEKMLVERGVEPMKVAQVMRDFDVAIRYQGLPAIALVLVGLVALHGGSVCLDIAAFLFALGTLLFSASIETASLLDTHFPWFIVPAGGVAFIAGWISLAIGAFKGMQKRGP